MNPDLTLAEQYSFAGDPDADRKRQALRAVLRHPTIPAASEAAGVDRDTLWRWMNEPAFQQALANAHHELDDRTLAALQAGAASVATFLTNTLRDPKTSPADRLRVAETILKLGQPSRKSALQRRLDRLEQALQARQTETPPASSETCEDFAIHPGRTRKRRAPSKTTIQ